jgi:hypothetical protein
VVHTCNPSTQESEEGKCPVPGQPGLYSETLFQKRKKIRHLNSSFLNFLGGEGTENLGCLALFLEAEHLLIL